MYKFNSVYLELSQDKTVYERSTYSFLEWLGDVGGLADALRIIGLILVRPFAYFVLKMELLSRVYRSSNDATAIFDQKKIPRQYKFLKVTVCRCRDRYEKMLRRANQSIVRQLDLVRYVKLRQMMWLNVLTELKPSQLNLIDILSTMVIHDTSDLNEQHENASSEGKAPLKESINLKKLEKSTFPRDRRLNKIINFRVKKKDIGEELNSNRIAPVDSLSQFQTMQAPIELVSF